MAAGWRLRKAAQENQRELLELALVRAAFALLAAQFMPPLFLYVGLGSSLSLGTAAAILVIMSIYFASWAMSNRYAPAERLTFDISPWIFASACALVIVPHAAIAELFQSVELGRLLAVTPLLFMLVTGGILLGRMLLRARDAEMIWALRISFAVLCLALILRIAGLEPLAYIYSKPLFPFSETSHFVLVFVPVLIYRCVNATRRATFGWLVLGFAVAVGLQSLTLLIAGLLTAIACRRILIVGVAALLVGVAGVIVGLSVVPVDLDYFISRLDLSSGASNLSSLVYVQGWQLLDEAVRHSFGWGIGFEQLGFHGTGAAAADAIRTLMEPSGGESLNLTDGSFVFAKLTGEMGVFGLGLSVMIVTTAIRSVVRLRRIDRGLRERPVIVFARCVMVSYLIDMFVRGTGYFVGSTLLAISAGSILLSNANPRGLLTTARSVLRPLSRA
jgi:hypothetical protein